MEFQETVSVIQNTDEDITTYTPVSYTHLDVYKRQSVDSLLTTMYPLPSFISLMYRWGFSHH